MKKNTRKTNQASEAIQISADGGPTEREAASGRDVVPPASTSLSPRGGAKHRTLKKQILALLAEAGPEGQTIQELADKLDVLKVRVQSWFSGTGKRTPEVEKVAPGRWRIRDHATA